MELEVFNTCCYIIMCCKMELDLVLVVLSLLYLFMLMWYWLSFIYFSNFNPMFSFCTVFLTSYLIHATYNLHMIGIYLILNTKMWRLFFIQYQLLTRLAKCQPSMFNHAGLLNCMLHYAQLCSTMLASFVMCQYQQQHANIFVNKTILP